MANHETTMWLVSKEPTIAHPKYAEGILPEHFIFRTLRKANDFRRERSKKVSKRWRYTRPVRAKWGPDNVTKKP